MHMLVVWNGRDKFSYERHLKFLFKIFYQNIISYLGMRPSFLYEVYHCILQWYPTGVPRHTRVPWAGDRGVANRYNPLIFIPIKPPRGAGCRQMSAILRKGAANKKRLGNTGIMSYFFLFQEPNTVTGTSARRVWLSSSTPTRATGSVSVSG